jgi:hypothetical protein
MTVQLQNLSPAFALNVRGPRYCPFLFVSDLWFIKSSDRLGLISREVSISASDIDLVSLAQQTKAVLRKNLLFESQLPSPEQADSFSFFVERCGLQLTLSRKTRSSDEPTSIARWKCDEFHSIVNTADGMTAPCQVSCGAFEVFNFGNNIGIPSIPKKYRTRSIASVIFVWQFRKVCPLSFGNFPLKTPSEPYVVNSTLHFSHANPGPHCLGAQTHP